MAQKKIYSHDLKHRKKKKQIKEKFEPVKTKNKRQPGIIEKKKMMDFTTKNKDDMT